MTEANTLVLEILKQDTILAMSIFEHKEIASTLRHYSRLIVSLSEIDQLCREIALLLNGADREGSLDVSSLASLKKAGHFLWDNLFSREIKDRLRRAQTKELVLSLDEELVNIPWELLYNGEEFLCLKFNLGRLVRTKEKLSPPQYRGFSLTPRMLILANPTNDLKGAYTEGTFIKNQFDRRRKQVSIDFKSSNIDTLYVKKNLRDYDIIHFAGHCEYDSDDPENSGWVLSDGKFTGRDIHALGQGASLPSLIFSNACHSARLNQGSPDTDTHKNTYSIASAFLFSGVRHYIGAMRRIEDASSLVFSREFYAQLISGRPVGECIRLGRLALAKEYGSSSIWWASYILYGDPNFVLFSAQAIAAKKIPKKKVVLSAKRLAWLGAAVLIASLSLYLYMWLPTINPSSYILFLQARSSFLRGNNEQAMSISRRIVQKDPAYLAVYPLLGDIYRRAGDGESALKYYFEYAVYSEKKNDLRSLSSAYLTIGWAYHMQGVYPKALDFYNKAQELSRKNGDKLNEAASMGKLAVWYIDKGQYDRALELLTKSSEINRHAQHIYQHRYNLACDYFNLGLLFTDKDDFATAKEFYMQSYSLFNKLKLEYELSDYYFNMGEIYSFQKEYHKAMACYEKGLRIDVEQENKPSLAADYNMIGELYVEMDQPQQAEDYFNRAASLAREIKARPELAGAYYNLGMLYKKANKRSKAREYLRSAQEIYRLIDTPEAERIRSEFSN